MHDPVTELYIQQIMAVSDNFGGRQLAIWGTRENGALVKGLLDLLGFECSFFVSSRGKTDSFCDIPLLAPDVLNVHNVYVIVTTISWDVQNNLHNKGYVNGKDYIRLCTRWHEDIEHNGCFVGRGTYGYLTLGGEQLGRWCKSIGRYCSINSTARIDGNHLLDCVSTHPFLLGTEYGPFSGI